MPKMSLTDWFLLLCVRLWLFVTHALKNFGKSWQAGKPLKFFLVTYSGARNTGADMRVEEIVRQIHHLLGKTNCELWVMTINPELTQGYFPQAQQKHCSYIFLKWLFPMTWQTHGVIACEGSMFKSQFSNVLPLYLIGTVGMAEAQDKLALSYGIEAGKMNTRLWRFAKRTVGKSLAICRNPDSQRMLQEHGFRTALGTDTAWTFSTPDAFGQAALRNAGWDGKKPIVALAVINPFCWPVKASIAKWAANALTGAYAHQHYASIYFFSHSAEREKKLVAYLEGIAKGVEEFRKHHDVFPIFIGMERLDAKAIARLKKLLPGIPAFISHEYNMYELMSILRQSSYVLSSRYHAVVGTMPASIPSAAISMDVRLRNLMQDRGHEHLLADVDDLQLDKTVARMLESMWKEREAIQQTIGRFSAQQIKLMGEMGLMFCDEVRRTYPEFVFENSPQNWKEALPPLSKENLELLERYG